LVELTHFENTTAIVIHAEGVLVVEARQAVSSTPKACGVLFIIRAAGARVVGGEGMES